MAQRMGGIHLHQGPMFAGKTLKLLHLYDQTRELGLKSLVLSHASDNRYATSHVVSHCGKKAPCRPVTELRGINISNYHIIFIDEAQFMPDLVQFCNHALECGKVVHVFGLANDYLLREFRAMTELNLIADSKTEMVGVCSRCGEDATTTARIAGGAERIEIGSAQYQPRCHKCHTVPETSTNE